MKDKSLKWLSDICHHGEVIVQACDGLSLDDYRQNELLRLAVERSFEIIGEAARRLRDHDPDTASRISQVDAIVGFRNQLAHGYDHLDEALVWGVITTDLPVLLEEAIQLLGSP